MFSIIYFINIFSSSKTYRGVG